METNNTRRPSLWKQLLGAVGGAAIALLLYQAYKVSAPIVTAWLVVPQSQIDAEHPGATRVNAEVSDYEFDRLTAKAREIYERFAAEQGPQANVLPGGIEVTQPTPISSSSIARVDLEDLVASSSSAAFSAMAVETASSSVMAQAEQVVLATESASSARRSWLAKASPVPASERRWLPRSRSVPRQRSTESRRRGELSVALRIHYSEERCMFLICL